MPCFKMTCFCLAGCNGGLKLINEALIRRFLDRYGTPLTGGNSGETEKGMVFPSNRNGGKPDRVFFAATGYVPEKSYVILAAADSRLVCEGSRVELDGNCYHITAVEPYYFAGKALYLRAFADRTDWEKGEFTS